MPLESPTAQQHPSPTANPPGKVLEVLLAFLRLGLTSFGGPIAHLGYFRAEFVQRRGWLDDGAYSDLVALCQFLPGPASSQVGMALGLARAGWPGLLAAWVGFTLPSALLLILFGYGIAHDQVLATSGAVHGLKLAAVAIVTQAVWAMGRSLCPDRARASVAVFAALLTLAMPSALGQAVAIVAAGLIGRCLPGTALPAPVPHVGYHVSRRAGVAALALLALLLVGLPLWAATSGSAFWSLVNGVFRAGALVFGGGHVVLPLLQAAIVPSGAVSNAEFLAGYGAAQAVPGPLFTFAAYLGAVMHGPVTGWLGGLLCLSVIFLPALLLLVGALPFWQALSRRTSMRAAMAGVNAGVVGLLLSALYDPVWTSTVHTRADFGVVLGAFALQVYAKISPIWIVAASATAGWLLAA